MKNIFSKNNKGFVLVETIVAVALFSIVMTVAIISLLSLVEANKKTQTFKIVVNNVNLALENMSKEIRVGSSFCGYYSCDSNNFSFNSRLHTDSDPHRISYRLNNNSIESRINGDSWLPITAPDIVVEKLDFSVRGQDSDDDLQPKVFIVVSGYSGKRAMDEMKFELQTTVSQRTIKD